MKVCSRVCFDLIISTVITYVFKLEILNQSHKGEGDRERKVFLEGYKSGTNRIKGQTGSSNFAQKDDN